MAASVQQVSTSKPVQERPFRVIIAGAGVAGLAFAHALQKAGIDHVILEKGVVAPDWGASISLWGNGSRILSQLGCLGAIESVALPLKTLHVRSPDGSAFSQENYFDMMLERNGFEAVTIERKTFLEIVHRELPDKSVIRTGTRVVDTIDSKEGIRVILADGTVEEGDVLIGCDGVHSTVRELMWKSANAAIPDFISVREKQSLVTTYKSLVGVADTIPGLGIRDMHWVCHRNLSFLILTQPDKTFFFVNWKLPQQIRWPTKAKWSKAEAEEAAASVAELPICNSLVFGELWNRRRRAHLIGLEEGIFDHWSFGRIALVGDSVHKVTPNFALGANSAMESVVTLVNGFVKLRDSLAPGTRASKQAIEQVLQSYQIERRPRMQVAFDASAFITRMQSGDGHLMHFIMRWVFPNQGQAVYADKLADLCCGAPSLGFLPIKYDKPATYKWKDDASHKASHESPNSAWKRLGKVVSVELMSLLAILVFIFGLFGPNLDSAGMASAIGSDFNITSVRLSPAVLSGA